MKGKIEIIWLVFILAILFGGALAQGHAQTGSQNKNAAGLWELARQGDGAAMCDLGLAYYHGQGVLKDPFKAKCWIERAHDLGVRRAEKIWNRLELWQYGGSCPPDFDRDPGLERQASSRNRAGEVFLEPMLGMAFVWVPGKCPSRDRASRACVEGFWMGQFEVTQAQWEAVMGTNPSRFKGEDLPVEQVSYSDVKAFVQKLNQRSGLGVSLPTTTQWELACAGPKNRAYPWGREDFRPQANCGTCDAGSFARRTAPVGSFPPNALGIHDMGGNVKEWCRREKGDRASDRPVKGGAFVDAASAGRCLETRRLIPGMKSYYLGFRLTAKHLPLR